MKAKLFPVLLLLISLFGCNEEDLSPKARVQGTYEFLYEINQSGGQGLQNFARTIELRADGTFFKQDITRNISSGEVLGYRGYSSGTYTIEDGKVKLQHEEIYSRYLADLNYVPKEELQNSGLDGYFELYTILNNYSELEVVCPSLAYCGELHIYKKLN